MLAAVRPQRNAARRQQHSYLHASASVNRLVARGELM
jgi:hypothetical protein